jgi:hypothetical protein
LIALDGFSAGQPVAEPISPQPLSIIPIGPITVNTHIKAPIDSVLTTIDLGW